MPKNIQETSEHSVFYTNTFMIVIIRWEYHFRGNKATVEYFLAALDQHLPHAISRELDHQTLSFFACILLIPSNIGIHIHLYKNFAHVN